MVLSESNDGNKQKKQFENLILFFLVNTNQQEKTVSPYCIYNSCSILLISLNKEQDY